MAKESRELQQSEGIMMLFRLKRLMYMFKSKRKICILKKQMDQSKTMRITIRLG